MKNIHILPTDKLSRLCLSNNSILIIIAEANYNFSHIQSVNIYITSDEEIKDGEKCITFGSDKCEGQLDTFQSKVSYSRKPRKIILTTDQDLIKDGVQSIDDEFLKWFVKNPSCEEVEVEESTLLNTSRTHLNIDKYKLIIPKEEPKQETLEEDLLDTAIQIVGSNNVITIREFLIKHKWQQDKKLYSEEEVIAMLKSHKLYIISELRGLSKFKNEKEWFKQFKKK